MSGTWLWVAGQVDSGPECESSTKEKRGAGSGLAGLHMTDELWAGLASSRNQLSLGRVAPPIGKAPDVKTLVQKLQSVVNTA